MKADLYPIFGGADKYREADWQDVLEQQLVWIGRHEVEAEQEAELQAKLDAQEREMGRH